jgi:hypothetical protein
MRIDRAVGAEVIERLQPLGVEAAIAAMEARRAQTDGLAWCRDERVAAGFADSRHLFSMSGETLRGAKRNPTKGKPNNLPHVPEARAAPSLHPRRAVAWPPRR